MIRVASIGYRSTPDFEVDAPEQPSLKERAVHAVKNKENIREAAVREGIDPERLRMPVRKPPRKSTRAKL